MAAIGHLFPLNLVPSRRVYTPPVFPSTEFQGLNGAVTQVQFGQKAVDSRLEMTFQNITDDQAYEIFQNYELVMKGRDDQTNEADYVDLQGQMKGIGSIPLKYEISQDPNGNPRQDLLRYRYVEPPRITSVFPGRSTVTVVLRGYFDAANSI